MADLARYVAHPTKADVFDLEKSPFGGLMIAADVIDEFNALNRQIRDLTDNCALDNLNIKYEQLSKSSSRVIDELNADKELLSVLNNEHSNEIKRLLDAIAEHADRNNDLSKKLSNLRLAYKRRNEHEELFTEALQSELKKVKENLSSAVYVGAVLAFLNVVIFFVR